MSIRSSEHWDSAHIASLPWTNELFNECEREVDEYFEDLVHPAVSEMLERAERGPYEACYIGDEQILPISFVVVSSQRLRPAAGRPRARRRRECPSSSLRYFVRSTQRCAGGP